MNAAERSQVHQALLSRRQAMADNWHKAIARTSFAPLKAVKVRQHLAELTEEIIALLLTERFERGRAETIGASLANFHYIDPEALGRTQEILVQQLVEGLPADQVVELQPRLAALLGELATGFSQQARTMVLAEQEWIHGALTRELRWVEEALRRERDLAEALAEAAAVVSSTLDHDQVLDHILEQVSRVVPSDAANIMLIDGDQVHVARWRGYERFGVEEFISTIVFQVPEMTGFQQMVESGEPVAIPDTATYPGWVHLPATEWLRSYAAAPIVVRGEVIGFLNVDSATPGFFTQAHTQALRAFAGHAAAAIENAQLYKAAKQELAERKRAEEELIRLSSAVKTSVDSIVIIDLEGKVIDVNEAALKMYGVDDKGDLIGQQLLDLVAPEQREKALAGIEFVLEKGYDTSRGYEVITKDGRRIPLDLSASVMKDADGKPMGIVIIARDITERLQAEECLLRTERLAAMGRLAAALAHEINNPLQAIGNSLELALDFPLEEEERQKYLLAARGEIDRLITLTDHVLQFARPLQFRLQPASVAHVVRDALELAGKQLDHSNIRVSVDLPEALPLVLVSASHLSQVFLNLMINAIEAMPDGGKLNIAAWLTEEQIKVTFTDSGPGIAPDIIAKLFEPFYTTKENGTGLGLSISHSIIQQHGGTITASNAAGGGAVLTIALPIVPLDEPHSAERRK